MNEEYFTNNMKPYAENINDGLLIADGVDLTVYTKLPQMFNDGKFPNEINNTRQCGVSLVTLIEKEGTVEINNTDITGSGSVVFKIYPNFNQFHKWNRISWVCETGTLTCSLEKIDGTEILSDIENGAPLTEHSELKKLQEINLVLNLENAVLTEISLEFVNNTTLSNRVIASISQANVTGLNDRLTNIEENTLSTINERVAPFEINTGWVSLSINPAVSYTISQISYARKGDFGFLNGEIQITAIGGDPDYIRTVRLGTLPATLRPTRNVRTIAYAVGTEELFQLYIYTDGQVTIIVPINEDLSGKTVLIDTSWICGAYE